MAKLSQEETNYLLIVNLVLRVAPLAVRIIFDQEFAPALLQRTLNKARFPVLDSLKKQHVFNKNQWEEMFPKSGQPSSKSFDMTHMISLIRHLIPKEISDVLPLDSKNISVEADLSRMKFYRNAIAHSKTGELKDKTFEEYWRNISQVIVRLGGEEFQQQCDGLKVKRLDEGDKEILIEVRNIYKEHSPVPIGLKEIHKITIDEWSQVVVAETRAIKRIAELIQTENIVFAVGSAGCGISTAIHHVALQLQSKYQYNMIPVYDVEEIRQYYNPQKKQVFVMDDVCGKSRIHIDSIRKWDIYSKDIKTMFERSHVKILCSCKTYIYQDRLFRPHNFLLKSICDFTSEYQLTYDERMEIANIYLNEDEVKCLRESSVCKFGFFPLLCSKYKEQNLYNVRTFFGNPLQVVKDDLLSLIDVNDKITLATLTLFIIYNDKITDMFFEQSVDSKKNLDCLSSWFDIEKSFSFDIVKSELDRLTQSYVRRVNNSYSLLYDEMYDMLLLYFGEHRLDLLLDVAPTSVIRDRFLFESLQEIKLGNDTIDTLIKIPTDKEQKYLNRLLRDIKSGFITNVLLNKQMIHNSFTNNLIDFLSKELCCEDILNEMDKSEIRKLFVLMLNRGYFNSFLLLFKERKRRDLKKKNLFWYFFKHRVSEKTYRWHIDVQEWYDDKIRLIAIVKDRDNEYINIIQTLLNNQCDLNIYYKGKTPLSIATKKGYLNIVKRVLKPYPNNMLKFYTGYEQYEFIFNQHMSKEFGVGIGKYSQTRKFVATQTDIIIVETSMFYKIDYPFTPGEVNCFFDFTEGLLNTILMSLPSVSTTYFSDNPLFKAAEEGAIDSLKLLLEKRADPNVGLMGEPPLFIAVQNGHFGIVKLLLEYEADPNIKYFHETALHLAAKKGKTDIVEILLQNKADPNIEGMFEIPMNISVSNGNINITVNKRIP